MKALITVILCLTSFAGAAHAGTNCAVLGPKDPKFPESGSEWYPLTVKDLGSETLLQCPTMIAGDYGFVYTLDRATESECLYKRGSIKAKCEK